MRNLLQSELAEVTGGRYGGAGHNRGEKSVSSVQHLGHHYRINEYSAGEIGDQKSYFLIAIAEINFDGSSEYLWEDDNNQRFEAHKTGETILDQSGAEFEVWQTGEGDQFLVSGEADDGLFVDVSSVEQLVEDINGLLPAEADTAALINSLPTNIQSQLADAVDASTTSDETIDYLSLHTTINEDIKVTAQAKLAEAELAEQTAADSTVDGLSASAWSTVIDTLELIAADLAELIIVAEDDVTSYLASTFEEVDGATAIAEQLPTGIQQLLVDYADENEIDLSTEDGLIAMREYAESLQAEALVNYADAATAERLGETVEESSAFWDGVATLLSDLVDLLFL